MQTLSNKSKVRRCLFGPPDHDSLRKDLDKAMEESSTEFISKYNYDFKNDVPLEGKFQWEVVNDGSYIPEFYKKSYPVKVKRSERRISDLNVKMTSGNLSSLSFDRLGTDTSDSEPNNTNCENSEQSSLSSSQCNMPNKLVQTQISAFMPKRKRSRSEVTSSVRAKAPRL